MRPDYKIKYVSASGEVLDLSGGSFDAIPTALPSWELEAITLNNSVAGLRRNMPTFEIPLIIVANSPQDGIEARNALYTIPARDRSNLTPGRMYVNEWFIHGYLTASTVDNFWQLKSAAQYVLTFMATDQKWTYDYEFNIETRQEETDEWLNFSYDFPYNFGGKSANETVENINFMESPATIRMYGASVNPFVTIAGNTYQANVRLNEGDFLEVDTLNAKVTVRRVNGATENAFSKVYGEFEKGSGSYIFQPIPPGVAEVQWPGNFDVDVIVHDQRDEPKWN